MHSRIFGITEKNFFDENQDNYAWNLHIFECETPGFADYCSLDTELDEDCDWLVGVLKHDTDKALVDYNPTDHTIKFKPGFKELYFKPKWEKLLKQVLGNPDAFDQFCGNAKHSNDIMYDVKKCIDEEFGFYVADDYGSYETFDSFVRRIDYDETYVIYASVDYHY